MISRLVLTIWRNVIWEALSRSRELAVLAAFGAIACALAVEFMIVEVASPLANAIHTNLGAQGQADLTRLTFDEIALAAALIVTLLSGLAPNLSALDRNLAAMPIRPSERYIGYLVPTLVISLAALVLLFAPVAWVISAAEPGPVWVGTVFGLQILVVILVTTFLQLFVTVTLTRVFGLSEVLSRMLAAVCVGISYLTVMLSDISVTIRSLRTPLSALGLISIALDPTQQTATRWFVLLAGVAGVVLMAAGILWLATLLVRSEGAAMRPLFPSFIEGGRGTGNLLVTAARLASRHPENRVTILLYFGLAVLLAGFLASQGIAGQWSGLAILLAAAGAASLGLNAYGRTRPMRWIVVVAPLRRRTWLAVNATGAVFVSAAAAVLLTLPFVLASPGTADPSALVPAALGIFVLTFAWMHGIGVVVPYSEEVPLSSALVSLAALVLGLPLLYLLSKIGLMDGSIRSVLLVVAMATASALVVSWVDGARLKTTGP